MTALTRSKLRNSIEMHTGKYFDTKNPRLMMADHHRHENSVLSDDVIEYSVRSINVNVIVV